MTNLDKVIEYLHYHPGASRRELMEALVLGIKDTQMKVLLGDGIANGDIRVEGKARATRYFITPKAQLLRTIDLGSYYAVETDKREMQTSYNFELIRDVLPKVEIFTKDECKFLADRENAFLARMKDYPKELYAKEMERLGIDLSWKSSEIEGNTYTLLETVNLLKDKNAFSRSARNLHSSFVNISTFGKTSRINSKLYEVCISRLSVSTA